MIIQFEYILLILLFGGIFFIVNSCKLSCSKEKEHYRDPIFLNRAKLAYDWYPRANGSIYGFPYRYGGSWSIFSGFPYYDRAY